MLSFEEFKQYYEKHGKCINDISRKRKKPLNEVELKTRYEKYLKSEKKRQNFYKQQFKKEDSTIIVKDELLEEIKERVRERDNYEDRILQILTYDEYIKLKKNAGKLLDILDVAHVLSRGAYPEFKYEIDNMVLLNRYSHSMLDSCKNPIDGKSITKEERDMWWSRILGQTQRNSLYLKYQHHLLMKE